MSTTPHLKIKDYVAHWNTDATPFEWTATPQEISPKWHAPTRLPELLANNSQ